jgi:hypothetical protein
LLTTPTSAEILSDVRRSAGAMVDAVLADRARLVAQPKRSMAAATSTRASELPVNVFLKRLWLNDLCIVYVTLCAAVLCRRAIKAQRAERTL